MSSDCHNTRFEEWLRFADQFIGQRQRWRPSATVSRSAFIKSKTKKMFHLINPSDFFKCFSYQRTVARYFCYISFVWFDFRLVHFAFSSGKQITIGSFSNHVPQKNRVVFWKTEIVFLFFFLIFVVTNFHFSIITSIYLAQLKKHPCWHVKSFRFSCSFWVAACVYVVENGTHYEFEKRIW
jgi:hypothetical protein